jgi:hypothetical protein
MTFKPSMSKQRTQIKGHHMGLPYESNEELYFLYWCEELMKKGIFVEVCRGETFVLSEAALEEVLIKKQLKTKTKEIVKHKKFLREHVYTNDFTVYVKEECLYLFDFRCSGHKQMDGVNCAKAYFEVKPVYDQNNMTRVFQINQKWVYDKIGHFINLFVPEKEFVKGFFPKKYLFTRTGKARNTNLLNRQTKIKTIDDFTRRHNDL